MKKTRKVTRKGARRSTPTLPHVHVRLTRKMLVRMNACQSGLDAIAPQLPLTLSTDPEDNVKVALLLADSPRAHWGKGDAYWATLALQCGAPAADEYDDAHERYNLDAWQVMQHLAMVADTIAMREGR